MGGPGDRALALRIRPRGAVIDHYVEGLPEADQGFNLVFSAQPFPGHQAALEWGREEHGGNWYFDEATATEGWLCPALFKYFEAAPERIYAQFKAKRA